LKFGWQEPHTPPQPSGPHCLPAQLGVQPAMHAPFWQTLLPIHWPQLPPQPSLPHCLPPQFGWQPHVPQPNAVTSATHTASQPKVQQFMSIMHTHSMTMASSHMGRGLV